MPNNLPKRAQSWLVVGAVAVLATGALAWRSLSAATVAAPPVPQTAGLEQLSKYLKPAADAAPASMAPDLPVVVARDPFGSTTPAVADAGPAEGEPSTRRNASTEDSWVVNAVLITGSYKAAIINDSLVTLGNKLYDGTRLTAVERDHIVLTDKQGTKRTITVRDGNN